MDYKKEVNRFRRSFFRRLTRNIVSTDLDKNIEPSSVRRILVIRPNHRLGNLLLITPLIQEITDLFPDASIDVLVKGRAAPTLFRNYDHIGTIISLPKKPFRNLIQYIGGWISLANRSYDMVINAVSHSSSGKFAARIVKASYKLSGEIDTNIVKQYPHHEHMALRPVYNLRYQLSRAGVPIHWEKLPYLDLKLSADEITNGQKILNNVTGNDKPTIALYTYATGDKCYSPAWWQAVYDRLKREFTAHNIIEVLPVENVSQLNFSIPSYYSKDLREICSLIANTKVFVGADSGMMHLASASKTATIGLFSVTNENVYRPYNPGSVAITTNDNPAETSIEIIRHVKRLMEKASISSDF